MPGACGLRSCARTHLKIGLVPHLPVRWGEQQIPQITIGVIPTIRDFLPFYVTLSFLCNIICYLMFVFSLVTLSGATTYWRQGTRTKKGLSDNQNGLIAQHTGEDTSQQRRDTQLQIVKESTTKFQHITNRTRFLLSNYKVSNCTNDGVCQIADI